MKNVLIPAGILAIVFVSMAIFFGVVAQAVNRKSPMRVVDFDFQGLRLGDPLPARLTVKNPKEDSVSESISGTKSSVWYSVLDGKVEAINISFESPHEAIDAYEQKLGVKGTLRDDDVVWMTQDGEFVISKKYSYGKVASKKYVDNAVQYMKNKTEAFSGKL